jgi:hypothetical protein
MVSDEEGRLGLPSNWYGPETRKRRWAGPTVLGWAARLRGEKKKRAREREPKGGLVADFYFKTSFPFFFFLFQNCFTN